MLDIKLLPHNQDMVKRIEKAMIDGCRKIFFSEATGLGKSFIFMYLSHNHFKGKRILYICPKNCIWYNMNDYEEFKLIKDRVTMMCYANFNEIKPEHMDYDIIFIDEAHHLHTEVQGKNILKVVDMTLAENPDAYAFGFTATPYVGNKMIGDLYFDTSVMGMDLFEAIDNGILQKINYAVAIEKEIKLTEEEMKLTKRFNVDTTKKTVMDLVAEYSDANHWLVYFTYIKELKSNIKYFEKYFPEFKLFIIHSDIDRCENVLQEFESYDGKAMLLTVSMVLEGIHPKSIDGILLYRNVRASNTLLQIIGRLGVINPNKNPIFVDIYDSFDNFIISDIVTIQSNNVDKGFGYNKIFKYIFMYSNTYRFVELSNMIYRLRNIHEYRGITWTSMRDLSIKLDKNESYVYALVKQGKTPEQIIDKVLDNKGCEYEYRGIVWTNMKDLSIKLGKSGSYVNHHICKGKTPEQIIDKVLDNKGCEGEYRGITWTSMRDLSIKLDKNENYVCVLVKQGKTPEQIIDKVLDNKGCEGEYRGIVWTSMKDLSIKLGKSGSYVRHHICKGKTPKQIIDMVLDGECYNIIKYEGEYRGIVWTSIRDLSNKLGKSRGYVRRYMCKGKTLEQIIDMVLDGNN